MSIPVSNSSTSSWDAIKEALRGLFAPDVFEMWFNPVVFVEEDAETLTLGVPNDFSIYWIQDNYMDLIVRQAQICTGRNLKIKLLVSEVAAREEEESKPSSTSQTNLTRGKDGRAVAESEVAARRYSSSTNRNLGFQLNPRNTFENFVVGQANQLAHAACLAVANAPARAYNPLFLYGETGLGKTHLMQAVAHHTLKANPEARIAYISSEKFTNEFITAIQQSTLAKFRQRYRSVDVLLIDDIHFLSGKESTQEEFFHTFNDLFESQRQIFLSSDKPASEIAKLENRLVSRFQWGLVTDIQSPDLETRAAILAKKAEALEVELPDAILQFLAERVSRNVRRMEGALTRVASFVRLAQRDLDIPTIERLLGDILQEEAQSKVTIEGIQKKVSDYFNIHPADMLSRKRPAKIAFARQVAMYLSRNLTGASLQGIGDAFGKRDHGTVIHAIKCVKNAMETDPTLRRSVQFLESNLSKRQD
jgi:chromosomal replication initiator protein